ncbi:MAG: hypothetical protein HOJ48_05195 [Desulfobacula sp.]|jgi:hypothetical protein|nr:hypothetical protein [Desulfobacula sp.]MBT7261571.1 hypothetical protein [Desulfobacula sp.]
MKKATKAALLSAFVFPGAGHLHLKKYIRGVLLAISSFAAIYYLLLTIIETALQIVEKIRNGDIQPDISAISQLLLERSAGSESQLLNIATALLIVCWIISIIDSYRIGRKQDQNIKF